MGGRTVGVARRDRREGAEGSEGQAIGRARATLPFKQSRWPVA